MINKNSKIYLTGHTGLVGSSILRLLKNNGFKKILFATSKELDLRDQKKVFKFLNKYKPEFVINAAAKVGGIQANNSLKAEFIYDNLAIETNIIHGSYINNIKNLIFLGSSCIYPRNSSQPIKEKNLLTGLLEKTNEPYAIAKIAGIKMCESYNFQYKTNYKCLMPTNTFGPNDNYDSLNSHFFPSLIKKIHAIKKTKKNTLILWGDGSPKRELIFVEDLAEACVFFMNKKIKESLINIGTGKDFTIKEYANLLLRIIYPDKKVKIKFDKTKPNGTLRKVLDINLAKKYGWVAKTNIKKAIQITYKDYLAKSSQN